MRYARLISHKNNGNFKRDKSGHLSGKPQLLRWDLVLIQAQKAPHPTYYFAQESLVPKFFEATNIGTICPGLLHNESVALRSLQCQHRFSWAAMAASWRFPKLTSQVSRTIPCRSIVEHLLPSMLPPCCWMYRRWVNGGARDDYVSKHNCVHYHSAPCRISWVNGTPHKQRAYEKIKNKEQLIKWRAKEKTKNKRRSKRNRRRRRKGQDWLPQEFGTTEEKYKATFILNGQPSVKLLKCWPECRNTSMRNKMLLDRSRLQGNIEELCPPLTRFEQWVMWGDRNVVRI